MRGFGINDVFSLAGYAIRKRKPTVEESIPTVDDLEAELGELRASETPENPPEVAEPTDNTQTPEKTPPAADLRTEEGISGETERISQGTSCIPCSTNHFSTCAGVLSEALRFARKDGIQSSEVISRIGLCADELNAAERIDLRAEEIVNLPDWEKELANGALVGSRDLRHNLENIASVEDLEKVAANAQQLRRHIGEGWLKGRIARMKPEAREKLEEKTQELLGKEI